MTNREKLAENGYEDAVVFENPDYDRTIIGVTTENCVVYDYDTMLECLMTDYGMSIEMAMDFVDCSSIRACAYVENAPIILEVRVKDL